MRNSNMLSKYWTSCSSTIWFSKSSLMLEYSILKPKVRERKKTAVHGTLGMTYTAVEFNFQQILLKTLIPTVNTLKDTAVLNIVKTDGKWN